MTVPAPDEGGHHLQMHIPVLGAPEGIGHHVDSCMAWQVNSKLVPVLSIYYNSTGI